MNKIIYVILIVVIIVGVSILLNNKKDNKIDNDNETTIKYASMDDIVEIMNENSNYIILDVRTIEEYNEGHIPNAICIPNETIDEDIVNKLQDKEQLILIYCRSGNRSKQAAQKLNKLGYTNLIEFGGIIDWKGEIVSIGVNGDGAF